MTARNTDHRPPPDTPSLRRLESSPTTHQHSAMARRPQASTPAEPPSIATVSIDPAIIPDPPFLLPNTHNRNQTSDRSNSSNHPLLYVAVGSFFSAGNLVPDDTGPTPPAIRLQHSDPPPFLETRSSGSSHHHFSGGACSFC
ncbi:hypothetical protein L1887_34550 [Cichorium endivia]|nr:hypothetical protein L1887_34550 [Cichorium endivia]